MWIDTHCHLDAGEFDADRDAVARTAARAGVARIVVPAVSAQHFDAAARLAHRVGGAYALGIHPLFTPGAHEQDLDRLREAVARAMPDPLFVGIGEIGLDYFVKSLDDTRQRFFFHEQLRLAREFDLPVICHVRRSQDQVAGLLRRVGGLRGIAHAFNGSFQQADAYLAMGFKLGFGGAATFERALQIRRLASRLPLESMVIETDAPDISPAWRYKQRNSPAEIPAIGAVLAGLRDLPVEDFAAATTRNAFDILPRLKLTADTAS